MIGWRLALRQMTIGRDMSKAVDEPIKKRWMDTQPGMSLISTVITSMSLATSFSSSPLASRVTWKSCTGSTK